MSKRIMVLPVNETQSEEILDLLQRVLLSSQYPVRVFTEERH